MLMYVHILRLHHTCVNRQDGSIHWPLHFGPWKFHRLHRLGNAALLSAVGIRAKPTSVHSALHVLHVLHASSTG